MYINICGKIGDSFILPAGIAAEKTLPSGRKRLLSRGNSGSRPDRK